MRGINRYGRASQGVKLMNLREDDVVSAVALVVESEGTTAAAVSDAELAEGPVELSAGAGEGATLPGHGDAGSNGAALVDAVGPDVEDDAKLDLTDPESDASDGADPDEEIEPANRSESSTNGPRRAPSGARCVRPRRVPNSPLGDVVRRCYFFDHQRKEVVRISSSSFCGTLEVAGR